MQGLKITSKSLPFLFTYPEFSNLAWKYGVLHRSSSLDEMFTIVVRLFSPKILKDIWTDSEKSRVRSENAGVRVINYFDPIYPQDLREIFQPPISLFYRGNIELLKQKMIAVVGTRNPSPVSISACNLLPDFLAKNKDSALVSGLALGIDREAMLNGVESQRPVIGVMGTGFDKMYPSNNKELYTKVLNYSDGLILSEMRWGEPVAKWSFPRRNRIITGLSETLIIMEAPLESGAMSSATHALSQNKEILVFDHPESLHNSGGRKLLSEGASHLSWDDLAQGKKRIVHASELFPKNYGEVTAYLHHLSKLELEGVLKNRGGGYYEVMVGEE